MVKITSLLAATLAGAAVAAPLESRQDSSSSSSSTSDLVCGALLQPLAGFLDYQAGNVGGNTNNILSAAQQILSSSVPSSSVNTILDSLAGGIVGSVLNGVDNILYGLATAADTADPECKQNAAYCTNELNAASAACAAGQSAQAQDACLQAKYTCARNDILSSSQVDSIATCCSQYTGSPEASS